MHTQSRMLVTPVLWVTSQHVDPQTHPVKILMLWFIRACCTHAGFEYSLTSGVDALGFFRPSGCKWCTCMCSCAICVFQSFFMQGGSPLKKKSTNKVHVVLQALLRVL
mmetsp:Transcript_4682/g.8459  ORF Transcript_4682/g.8459 Transcript_4682/m.8459 type:complete len:108 (-) Transcript_4682:38-361(-)